MRRYALIAAAAAAAVVMVACGSAAAGTTTPSPSAQGGQRVRNGAAGELVQINGMTLILSNANGDVTVTYTSATTITQQSTGTVADIAPGVCITATGQKDSAGHVTASTVRVSNAVNGACPTAQGPGFGNGNGPRPSPRPGVTPNPAFANFAAVRGQVTAGGVRGTSVTVQQPDGTTATITVPTTVRVTKASAVAASTLQTGQCVAAAGARSASGTVAARSLTIVPAGPSGCFTGGGFGGGGFGGGGFGGPFGGGGGGGGVPPQGNAAPV